MRAFSALALLLGAGATVAVGCGNDKDAGPSFVPGATTGGQGGHGGSGKGGARADAGAAADAGDGSRPSDGGMGSENGGSPSAGHAGERAATAGIPNSGDIGANAGAPGDGGPPDPGDETGRIYIGPGGYAAAPGTRDEPFATLAQAVAVATSGNTIVYLDGNYTEPALDEPLVLPDGVDIVADHARGALITAAGGALLAPAGTSHIEGLRLSGFATVLDAKEPGTVTLTRCTFSDCEAGSSRAIEVSGDAVVELAGGDSSHDWGDCAAFARVEGQGSLALDQGTLHFTSSDGAPVFSVTGDGTLALSNLRMTDGNRLILQLEDTSTTTVVQSTLSTAFANVVNLTDQASLDLTSTELSLDAAAASPGACIESTGTGSLALSHLLAHDCSAAVHGLAPATVTLTDVELYSMSESGLDFTNASPSTITIGASSFHDLTERAARFGAGSGVFHVTLRGSSIANVPRGFELDGGTGSSWDFGTLASPGSNTLTASMTALVVSLGGGATVSAVGNTWTPDVQGAGPAGEYAASGAGAVLEVTSGSGQNYDDASGATLRLAENPP